MKATWLLGMAMMSTGAHAATREETIDAWMRDYTGQVPGASVLVLEGGDAVFQRSYGLADLEANVASSPTTNYRLASVSKQFTAASVLLLVEDGVLTLDDPVRRWLRTLPVAAEAITLRHLLSHTSGLIDYEDLLPPDQAHQIHDADVLRLLEREDRLYFPAGSDYRYSNSGYALLALVVERASGQRFAAFLQARIFSPLGMTATLAREDEGPPVTDRAFGYTLVGDRWERTDQSTTSAVLGDGGIYSSITDLAKWMPPGMTTACSPRRHAHGRFRRRRPRPNLTWRITASAGGYRGGCSGIRARASASATCCCAFRRNA